MTTESQPAAAHATADGDTPATLEGHGGALAVAAARAHGVRAMFTLSGAHVFPLYDGAVKAEPPMPLVDVRHEQTAVFAAEATAKLTRTPGLAVLTAGPGVTNGVSAVTTAHFNGSPLLVIGGRAPAYRWGTGSLQELDHPPLLAPVTKRSATIGSTDAIAAEVDAALTLATSPHRGPVFLDVAMDVVFGGAAVPAPTAPERVRVTPDTDTLDRAAAALAGARRPLLVLGSDVWSDGAEDAAVALATELGLPVVPNGMGRGILPPSDPHLVTRARGAAFGGADVVVVAGTPLDFRLGYGQFGGKDGAPLAQVVHLADDPSGLARHVDLAAGVSGDLTLVLDGLRERVARTGPHPEVAAWTAGLRARHEAALAKDAVELSAESDPIHPARVYGDLVPLLADDAVVIGDGGDFVSFAGKYVEPARPGGWLDPGPYGCLGTGLGYAVAARLARPSAQVALMLGDGAAGFSLMDVDTLVRHRLPVVMVVGNNGMWGLEKHPMQMMFGYDVAAELLPQTRYDEVVRALGGAGELVTRPGDLRAALQRGFDSGVPYLVNVVTDPAVAYPRNTTGI
ncbi:acetolactate synthase [Kineosporia sp. A_224]|uniref:acetolactate synthase n=1 Tax=Kineosporia sp. A_224 TaxID=1962180 RepID=UPI000B4B1970|nr:acetolactate synthase [Kineosporia sp. A_224]